MAEIRLENITHTYGGQVTAVRNVTLTLPDGSNNALLGPSGCGKTTLMKIIAGLLVPTEGKVYFDGRDVTDLSPQDRNIAMVFQFPVIYDMTVLDNLMFPLLNKKVPKKQAQEQARRIAEVLGLTTVLNLRSKDIDMGARQRVTLGRALVRKPSAFLMDEPLSSIEPEGKWHLKMQIKEIQKTLEQTLIYVTHDQSEALTLADTIVVMNQGEFLQYASRDTIYETPATTFVGYFIGDPGMNFIDCVLKKDILDCGDFTYPVSKKSLDRLGKHGNRFKLGVRPEHVQVSKKEKAGWIPAELQAVEHLGNMQLLHLSAGKHEIKAKLETWEHGEEGSAWIRLPDEKVRMFGETGELIYA
jgi:glycerol transport system ATP-binding protein